MKISTQKTIKIAFIVLPLLVLPAATFASGEAHAGAHDVGLDEATIKTIIYQAINVASLIGLLIYFLRVPVKAFFKAKKETYMAAALKAQAARKNAEEEKMQIQVRLNKLENTADESLSRAKAEAAELRNQMIGEAEAASKRLRAEAQIAAQLEIEKAKNHLREHMISEAIALSRAQLNKVSNDDHQRLQADFINNIQAVKR